MMQEFGRQVRRLRIADNAVRKSSLPCAGKAGEAPRPEMDAAMSRDELHQRVRPPRMATTVHPRKA